MASSARGTKGHLFVPLEIASFLRAPYGWTNRMRLDEGHPARGERRPITIGFWANVVLAVGVYGPPIVGALLGWRAWGGWLGTGVGLLLGVAAQVVALLAVWPFAQVAKSARRRRRSDAR